MSPPRLIFPGSSGPDYNSGPTTTDHLRLLAKMLDRQAPRGQELTPACRELAESLLYHFSRSRGPISWRMFAEHRAGGNPAIIEQLKTAQSLVERALSADVKLTVAQELKATADQLERSIGDYPLHSQSRLRWLCVDMIDRLVSETSETGFGDFDVHVNEAAILAVLLGFPSPPVQRTHCNRDDGSTVEPIVGYTWPPPRHRRPDIESVFGYRLFDPVGGAPTDLLTVVLVEGTDERRPKLYDELKEKSKTTARATIVKILKRWVSAIDGIPLLVDINPIAPEEKRASSLLPIKPESEPKRLQPFTGGKMVYFPDHVEFCGVDICSGKRSQTKRRILDLLRKKQSSGTFVAYGGKQLAKEVNLKGRENAAAGAIRILRSGITASLRTKAYLECGRRDVILGGGPGYRFAACVSVHDGDESELAAITDIDDKDNVRNVRNADVRNVRNENVPNAHNAASRIRRKWILQRLDLGHQLRAPAVVKHFKCSLKTAQRDLRELREKGQIEFIGPSRTGYYRMRKSRGPSG